MRRTNKVRLTESQLNRVIKESVKQVLSETDWRTYYSAYEKADKRPRDPRTYKFQQAAINAFNRQNGYGLENVPFGDDEPRDMKPNQKHFYVGGIEPNKADTFLTASGRWDDDKEEADAVYNQQQIGIENVKFGDKKYKRGVDYTDEFKDKIDAPRKTSFNPALKIAQMKGDKQVRDYFNGKSKYKNGKWS